MPLPAAAVAAYSAFVSALPAAAPFVGATIVSLSIVASHTPEQWDLMPLMGTPELAAECMQRNVAALNTRLVAVVQPLYGMETMGVIVQSGMTGNQLMSVVIQTAGPASQAEFRPITKDQQPDMIAKMIAGC